MRLIMSRREEGPLRLRLITKLTLITSLVLLLAMALFVFFNVRTLEKALLEKSIDEVDNLSETLIRTTHYQMLEDDRNRVYQMIREVGSQKGIEHIRLINKDGTIIFSTDQREIGTIMDKNRAEACNMCHKRGSTLTHASSMNRSRFFRNARGEVVLGMAKAIYNQKSCATADCHFHSPESKLLGVLDVIVSLESMRSQLTVYRNNLIVETFLLLFSLSACLTLLTQRLVNRPVRLLLGHTRALARGEWRQIDSAPRDELGELAEAFNDMTQKLKKAREELQEWAATLEAKVEERTNRIKEMQSELIRSEKLASLGELVAGIAHEINNPLTGILMFASMLARDPRLDPALKGDLETIIRETQRCGNIVRELLNFSRESLPQKSLNSVNRVMETTLALVQHQAYFHDIEVVKDLDPRVPEVLMDPGQMQQVFINMLVNASQAMPKGGTLTIRSGARPEIESIFVQIRDTGGGIDPENLERIFDPFFTTKGHNGTGLGLAVSYGIVENHGGEIEVESRVGEGTCFTIRLPMGVPKPADQPRGDGASPASPGLPD